MPRSARSSAPSMSILIASSFGSDRTSGKSSKRLTRMSTASSGRSVPIVRRYRRRPEVRLAGLVEGRCRDHRHLLEAVDLDVVLEVAERLRPRLEREHTAAGADDPRHQAGEVADARADVDDDLAGRQDPLDHRGELGLGVAERDDPLGNRRRLGVRHDEREPAHDGDPVGRLERRRTARGRSRPGPTVGPSRRRAASSRRLARSRSRPHLPDPSAGTAPRRGGVSSGSGSSPSTVTCGSHDSQPGSHQFQSPSSRIVAGSRIAPDDRRVEEDRHRQPEAELLDDGQLERHEDAEHARP